jgi:ubiquinone/menaquinone biosynthesis C-methylase UbiE
LVCADAAVLPVHDGAFGAITTQHLIEHIADAERLLNEWRRVLRPGGWLVILTPNRLFSDPSVYHDDTHVHIYDAADLASLLRRTNFIVKEVRTIGIDWFRHYNRLPAGWRFRRSVLKHWKLFSKLPGTAATGQTLCAIARRAPS